MRSPPGHAAVPVRDSKAVTGTAVAFSSDSWSSLVAAMRSDCFVVRLAPRLVTCRWRDGRAPSYGHPARGGSTRKWCGVSPCPGGMESPRGATGAHQKRDGSCAQPPLNCS
nr:DUF397 domain-containing protein [Streptomyces sp. SID9727]